MTERDAKIIKDAEERNIPIFVLTAKDKLSVDALVNYRNLCMKSGCIEKHYNEVDDRLHAFINWQDDNEDKVKLPD